MNSVGRHVHAAEILTSSCLLTKYFLLELSLRSQGDNQRQLENDCMIYHVKNKILDYDWFFDHYIPTAFDIVILLRKKYYLMCDSWLI